MTNDDCRCPGCGTCNAASEVNDLRKSLRGWRQRHAELSRINESYIKHLHAAERERDELKARLAHAEADAEQAIKQRDEARTQIAALRKVFGECLHPEPVMSGRGIHKRRVGSRACGECKACLLFGALEKGVK